MILIFSSQCTQQ